MTHQEAGNRETDGRYIGLGAALGSGIGTALGVAMGTAFGNLAIGIAIGTGSGVAIGVAIAASKKEDVDVKMDVLRVLTKIIALGMRYSRSAWNP